MSLYNKHFYNQIIRKYVVSFGNIFNNIYVVRYNPDGGESQREKVPMAYGPKEKYLYRNKQNPDLNERFAIKLPRISYEMLEVRYDPSRKTASNLKLKSPRNVGNQQWTYNPLPFQFVFKVSVMGKTSDECLQIIEQIAPFFTPDYTMTIDVLPGLHEKLDIPITMDNMVLQDNWDGDFSERRNIIWDMQFTLNGYLYPPVRQSKIILQSEWNILGFDDDGLGEEVYSSGIETDPTPIE